MQATSVAPFCQCCGKVTIPIVTDFRWGRVCIRNLMSMRNELLSFVSMKRFICGIEIHFTFGPTYRMMLRMLWWNLWIYSDLIGWFLFEKCSLLKIFHKGFEFCNDIVSNHLRIRSFYPAEIHFVSATCNLIFIRDVPFVQFPTTSNLRLFIDCCFDRITNRASFLLTWSN